MTCRNEAASELAILRPKGSPEPDFAMIVCSCNVLSDHEVRRAVNTAAPRTTAEVYGCLGCSAQCGRCAHTIRKIMDEALMSTGRPAGCGCAGRGRPRD